MNLTILLSLVSFFMINLAFTHSSFALTNENEHNEQLQPFKNRIINWASSSVKPIAESINDNIVLETPKIKCEKGDGSWRGDITLSCSLTPILGKGDHATYAISAHEESCFAVEKEVFSFYLHLSTQQNYDEFGNYSDCEYQWREKLKPGIIDNCPISPSFKLTNIVTNHILKRKSGPSLELYNFEPYKISGKCDNPF